MPLKFWDEAFLTATYLINQLPSKVINFQTPHERLYHHKPEYDNLRIFGCACWPNLRPYNTKKLSFRSIRCTFLGYRSLHKGYKCLDISTGRVYISRDVVFDESVFPFEKLHPNAGARLHQEILLLPNHLLSGSDHGGQHTDDHMINSSSNHPSIDDQDRHSGAEHRRNLVVPVHNSHMQVTNIEHEVGLSSPSVQGPEPESSHDDPSRTQVSGLPSASPGSPAQQQQEQMTSTRSPVASPGSSVHTGNDASLVPATSEVQGRPKTRLQSGIVKPKKLFLGIIRHGNLCATGEPVCHQEAMGDDRWRKAVDDEYAALMKNNTWHLVEAPVGKNLIDYKWVYKIKRKADGTIDRYKAQLVAKGFK